MDHDLRANEVLDFWFEETPPEKRFQKDEEFDRTIERRFGDLYRDVVANTEDWMTSQSRVLAAIIVLDQFSRNMFRDQAAMYAADPIAIKLSRLLIEKGWFEDLDETKRAFALLPFMHSEDASVHAWALPYFEKFTNEMYIDYEHQHKDIIDRFGRYPHRNQILSRQSTPEEIAFVEEHGGF